MSVSEVIGLVLLVLLIHIAFDGPFKFKITVNKQVYEIGLEGAK